MSLLNEFLKKQYSLNQLIYQMTCLRELIIFFCS